MTTNDASYGKMGGKYPQRVFRFVVTKEEVVTFTVSEDNPIFSYLEFMAMPTAKLKFRLLQELPDLTSDSKTIYEVVNFSEVDQWQG